MAMFLDVLHLEDNICVSCKDVKKQGCLRYYMLSAFLAMVQIIHALQSLWVTLLPFALLWWNAMLYATCAKYYSWNRSLLRLQTAGQRFGGDSNGNGMLESETSLAEEREKGPFSPHQTESSADASNAENTEMSVFSLRRQAACADAAKGHPQIHGFGVAIQSFRHQNGLHILDRSTDVAAACPENSGSQFEERVSCETTSLASKAQVIASSRASKLSSLCFLEGRQSQPSGLLKGGQWATCSFLLPHQVPPLDVHLCPQIPLKYSCLQVYLHRNANMLDINVPLLFDHAYINWPMLREGLQAFNRGYVPAIHSGKKCSDLAWNSTKLLDYAILLTTEGFNNLNTISSYDAVESLKLRIGDKWSSWDLTDFKMTRIITYVDNEGSGSDHSEDVGSVFCASFRSDDGCDGMYCTGDESTIDRDDGFDDSDVVYGKQCYRGEYCYCCCNCYLGYEDSGIHSAEDAEDVRGSFVHPAIVKEGSFYDCSVDCNDGSDGLHCATDVDGFCGKDYDAADGHHNNYVEGSGAVCGDFHFPNDDGQPMVNQGYNGLHCVTDVDGFCGMNYDAADGDYNNFDGNVEGSVAVCGDFHFLYDDDGVYEIPLEIRQVHVAKSNTWWDGDAVLVAKQECEEDSLEQEWQVV